MRREHIVKRALVLAIVLGAVAVPEPPGDLPARRFSPAPKRQRVHPMTLTQVWFHFEVETEGLSRSSWHPPPRDIDVTYRNLRTGRLVTLEGVGPNWAMKFWRPRFGRGRLEAHAHGGGDIWCVVEASHADASGWTISERGRHRCRVKRRLGTPYPWPPPAGTLE